MITGKALAKQHKIHARHALYRKTGDWYHVLRDFPGALFDAQGYLLFDDKKAYEAFTQGSLGPGVTQNKNSNTLRIRNGIAGLMSYVRF